MAEGQGAKNNTLKVVLLLVVIVAAIVLAVTLSRRRGGPDIDANPAQGEIDVLENRLINESATLTSEEKEQIIDQIEKLEGIAQ